MSAYRTKRKAHADGQKVGINIRAQKKPERCDGACVLTALNFIDGREIKEHQEERFYKQECALCEKKYKMSLKEFEKKHGNSPLIIELVRRYGYYAEAFASSNRHDALGRLYHETNRSPVMIAVEDGNHWVLVVSRLYRDRPKRVIIFDPDRKAKNLIYGNFHCISQEDLLKLWRTPDGKSEAYYGIMIRKEK